VAPATILPSISSLICLLPTSTTPALAPKTLLPSSPTRVRLFRMVAPTTSRSLLALAVALLLEALLPLLHLVALLLQRPPPLHHPRHRLLPNHHRPPSHRRLLLQNHLTLAVSSLLGPPVQLSLLPHRLWSLSQLRLPRLPPLRPPLPRPPLLQLLLLQLLLPQLLLPQLVLPQLVLLQSPLALLPLPLVLPRPVLPRLVETPALRTVRLFATAPHSSVFATTAALFGRLLLLAPPAPTALFRSVNTTAALFAHAPSSLARISLLITKYPVARILE